MPDDNPGAFSLYIDWLYRSTIPIVNTEAHLRNIYELYFLADKLCLVDLKDKTMDTIQDMAMKFGLMDELIKPDLVSNVIAKTRTKMERTTRLLCLPDGVCLSPKMERPG
jgi:hypothetical protein